MLQLTECDPLPGCRAGKEHEAVPEAAAAVHPDHLHTAHDKILPSNHANLFHWLPKDHMCLLVTMMHSMQAGHLEKVQKSTDKALMLVAGHKATALQEISQVCQLCQQPPGSGPTTQHTRPGLYCVSVNCVDNAEAQLTTALRLTSHQELWAFMVTNLVSVYIREGGGHQEVLYRVSERISPDHSFPVSSHCLLAAA
ncbi:hypothetical protein J1605_001528 [Eschrichtius robustus]|uniref:Cohesin loading complex subunit SCC4 homolog n=1 Tax=Eschrichtius robustus TaxID=9764 RepID=A0AB34I4R1_ESCRO|nr:hypothetical protein J1605_001528 [Eschrichtius robustus]MBV97759.1 MAU2 chromatid cohesion factor [Eschrichtius robustus]